MNTWKTCSILVATLVATGCGDPKQAYFASGGDYVTPDDEGDDTGTATPPDDDPAPDMDADMDADDPMDDSAEPMDDTGGGEQGFDNPGDIQKAEESGGGLKIDLTDLSGDSNQDQDFYLVLVNTGTDAAGYTLRYIPSSEVEEEEEEEGDGGGAPDEGGDGEGPPDEGGGDSGPPDEGGGDSGPPDGGGEPGMAPMPAVPLTAVRMERTDSAVVREIRRPRFVETTSEGVVIPPPSGSALDDTDIGIARRVFRVRRDISDDAECEVIDATLWALGEHAAIWVDGDVPIDRYFDCADLEEGGFEESDYDAHGFDNCDLETIVNIVDTNIVPNVTALLGDPSDEDGNGRVSIVISPVLNAISTTSSDEDEWETLVESYTDPEHDLDDYSSDENPCSDEQEVIFVYAPDPYGHFNPFATVTVDEYTGMDLAGRIVQGMVALVSYNQHVLVNESDAEEGWVTKGISAVVTDLLGFGAIFYDDAWDYMDAPHLYSLTDGNEETAECGEEEEEEGGEGGEGGDEPPPPSKTGDDSEDSAISTSTRGAQYLFFRWLVDSYGEGILADLVQTESTGVCNIEAVTEAELKDLAVAWQVALLTTGEVGEGGADFVDTDSWDLFKSPTLISAPTIAPTAGDYFGANGYQRGIDVSGNNLYRDGGTTDEPSEIEENAVKLGNTDYFTFVAAIPFNGYIGGAYAAHVVRVTDIPYAESTLEVQSSSSDIKGVLIRWHDPESVDYKVENVFSATDANNMPLPDLPEDGSPITGMGTISSAGVTLSLSPEGEEEAADVYDTDRWLLDLTDRSASEDITVVITVDRRYENTDGDIAPFDLWAAVVPQQFVPSPSVDGTRRGECEDGVDFGYPASMLDYLYYQMFLSPNPGADGVTGDFDPCGMARLSDTGTTDTASDDPTCGTDWDRDGVLDVDEPRPQSLIEQVMVMQCALAGGDFSGVEPYEAEDLIDLDSIDENDDPYVDRARNLGGQSGESEEEAYLETTLAGGARYVVVVGAGTETGPYELRVKQID